MNDTVGEYTNVFKSCLEVFDSKLDDYGASWRVLRLPSLTDQIYIKAQRIRTIQTIKKSKVPDDQKIEFIGIVNYCLIALIQIDLGFSNTPDISKNKALELFKSKFELSKDLMLDKNHDYGEAWKNMRISSITDIILQKILRLRQIEDNGGVTKISEGVGSNYIDIANYAMFSLIKIKNDR